MLRSLYSSISGLQNHQIRMDTIGNNIANVNTVGFKSQRVTFEESFSQLLEGSARPPGGAGGTNPVQVGLGMSIGSVDTLLTQGNISSTGQITDLAIEGNSYFAVADGDKTHYTRNGAFQIVADLFKLLTKELFIIPRPTTVAAPVFLSLTFMAQLLFNLNFI